MVRDCVAVHGNSFRDLRSYRRRRKNASSEAPGQSMPEEASRKERFGGKVADMGDSIKSVLEDIPPVHSINGLFRPVVLIASLCQAKQKARTSLTGQSPWLTF